MRNAPLLQPVRPTPAMQAMQANLPPAKDMSGNRVIVPKQSGSPVRRMLPPVNGGLPVNTGAGQQTTQGVPSSMSNGKPTQNVSLAPAQTTAPEPISPTGPVSINIDPKRAQALANLEQSSGRPVNGLPGTTIPDINGLPQTGGQQNTGGSNSGLLAPKAKTTSQPVEPMPNSNTGANDAAVSSPSGGQSTVSTDQSADIVPPISAPATPSPAQNVTQAAPSVPVSDRISAPAIPDAPKVSDAPAYSQATVDQTATVANRLNSLLSQDNPYLQLARLRAEQEAASRGLRNSTLGVQAGEMAAISAALPIAQQDAGQQFDLQRLAEQQKITERRDALLNAYQGQRDTRLNAMDLQKLAEQQKITERRDQLLNNYQSQRDAQLNQYQTSRDATLNTYQLQQMEKQQQITERRDQLLNQMQNNRDTRLFAMDMQKLQQNFENDLGKMGVEMSHQNRIAYTNSASALINSAMEQVSAIYQNPNMDVAQQRNAVRQVYQDLNSRFSALADIYQPLPGVDFEPQQQ